MEYALKNKDRVGVEDFVLLENYQDINAFVENLKKRFKENLIYTYIGNVLISVNPYTPLSIYSEKIINQYRQNGFLGLSPHIYAIVDTAYRFLTQENRGQCILISGESGSGKTEASKKVLQFVAAASNHHEKIESIKDKLVQCIPILEAFGNAKTNKNDNSSRFGKYMDIAFDYTGNPVGGNVLNYLLEKSRVVYQNKGERNFHIFYQLLKGAETAFLNKLLLNEDPKTYLFLQHFEQLDNSILDAENYHLVKKALNIIQISEEEQWNMFSIVASVLHLGNIKFEEDNDVTHVVDIKPIKIVAELLGCSIQQLEKALVTRTIEAADDIVITSLSKSSAIFARNALAKTIYDKLFTWLVNRINNSVQPPKKYKTTVLGILDIYGFEVFTRNGFEQFCINYCNEKLQQIFIQMILKEEQDEYLREGIKWTYIEFFDNKVICDLIEEKHVGIIGILNEECLRPGNTNDITFLNKMNESLLFHKHYINHQKSDVKTQKIMARDDFQLIHYAGTVTYNVHGFVDKNNDFLFRDLRKIMTQTSNFITQTFFTINEVNEKRIPDTTINQFKNSLSNLMEILITKEPSYVRCIKPNNFQKKGIFDEVLVKHQVLYLGLMENLRVRRAGFAYRRRYDDFLNRYKCLSKNTWPNYRGNSKDGVKVLISDLNYKENDYQLGRTKLFIRSPMTVVKTEDSFQNKKHEIAAIIQKTWKGRKQKLIYKKTRKAVIQIQAIVRGFLARKRAEKRRRAVKIIRRFIEGFITRHGPKTSINQNFVAASNAKWLIKLSKELPANLLDNSWPSCPITCKQASKILFNLYKKQLALSYRKQIGEEKKKKFEEKVLAEFLFKGKKKSYLQSIPHFFQRDRLNPEQKKMMKNFQSKHAIGEKFQYGTTVIKYDRHGYKPRERVLLISDKNVFLLDGKTFKVKHKISHKDIIEILVTKEADNFLLLRIPPILKQNKGDLLLQIPNLIEAVTVFIDITQNSKCLKIIIEKQISHNIINGKPGVIKISSASTGSLPAICKKKTGELLIMG